MDLSDEAQALKIRVLNEFAISDAEGLHLLQTGLEAFDRMRGCQQQIAGDGLMVRDRFDQPRPHPLLTVERDSRSQMLAAFKQLGLELTSNSKAKQGRPALVFG